MTAACENAPRCLVLGQKMGLDGRSCGCCCCSSPRSVAGACFSDSSSNATSATGYIPSTRRSLDSLLGTSCISNARSRNTLRSLEDGAARNLNFESCLISPRGGNARLGTPSSTPRQLTEPLQRPKGAADLDLLNAILPSVDEAGFHQRISALRVAFQASDRSRTEGEKETDALRKYLASVEAGASSLHLRVQELERQLHLLRSEEDNLDELKKNMLEEASREAESHAGAAAQAISAGREARMELDKTTRHYSSVVKSQEDEIVRLCKELENSRVLYQARAGQVESLKERIQMLEQQLQLQHSQHENNLDKEAYITEIQKRLESLQGIIQQKEAECLKLHEALGISNKRTTALEQRLQDVKAETKDVKVHNECLEQQVNELQNRQVMATIAHYDCELGKVRAVLGGEKAYLLSELALVRCKNKTLRGDLAEWQQKYKALSHHVSGLEGLQNVSVIENPLWESGARDKANETCKLASRTRAAEAGQVSSGLGIHPARPCRSGSNVGSKASQGKSDKVPVVKICRKDCCMCQQRDSILVAAHREIMKLNEINEWLVAACQKDVKLGKNTTSSTSTPATSPPPPPPPPPPP